MSVPVISVGNLALGGTGKTALVEYLVKRLEQPAVLTRGYRSEMEHQKPQLIDAACDARLCGDEPALLAKSSMVVVGKNRCEGAQVAMDAGAKVLVMDDGMQHRYLKRDLNIVIIDRSRLTREPLTALKRADLVMTFEEDPAFFDLIKKYTDAPMVGVRYQIEPIEGPVAAFCAIGNPKRFFNGLEKAGATLIARRSKRDHSAFSEKELQALHAKAPLVCTRKDYVKLKTSLPVRCVDAKLEFTFGKEHLDKMLEKIESNRLT